MNSKKKLLLIRLDSGLAGNIPLASHSLATLDKAYLLSAGDGTGKSSDGYGS